MARALIERCGTTNTDRPTLRRGEPARTRHDRPATHGWARHEPIASGEDEDGDLDDEDDVFGDDEGGEGEAEFDDDDEDFLEDDEESLDDDGESDDAEADDDDDL